MLKKKFRIFESLDDETFTSHDLHLWPFYAYEIVAPTVESQDLFAKFFIGIMRVENKRFLVDEFTFDKTSIARTKRMIKQQLPTLFSDELLDKITSMISEMDIVENNRISTTKFNETFNVDVKLSNNLKKMILLQDAVSGEVVPHIDFINDFDSISISNLRYEIKHSIHKKPTLLQIQKAYNYALLIEERKINNSATLDFDEMWFDDEDELDEQFISKLIQDEDITNKIKKVHSIDKRNEIIFLNDQPELVYFEFLPYSSIITNEVSFLSPFFDSSNSWFNNIVHKARSISQDVKNLIDSLQLISDEKHNELNKEIDLKIEENINDSVVKAFKEHKLYQMISKLDSKGLVDTFNEIQKLEHIQARTVNTEYVIFLEGLFSLISKPYDSQFNEIKTFLSQGRRKFQDTMEFLANRKKLEMPPIYYDKTRYDQINELIDHRNNTKHFFLSRVAYLLLLEAYMKKTVLSNIINEDKKFLSRLHLLNSARNDNSHFNKDRNSYDMKQISQEFEYVVTKILNEYMGGIQSNE